MVATRKTEREAVREECVKILKGLDDVEAHDLIRGDKDPKADRKAEIVESVVRERGRAEVSSC